jgi:glutathione S-transferase
METKTTDTAKSLRIVRSFDAPRQQVFAALTESALLSQWFAPSDEFEVYVDRFDAVVGGAYRIEMRHKNGDVHTCIGTIQEFDPPERLVYTWSWEGGEMGETIVAWDLREKENGTELVLSHDRFPNDEAVAHHTKGWTGIVGRLQVFLARPVSGRNDD